MTGVRGRLPGPKGSPKGPLRGGVDGGLVYPLPSVLLAAKAREETHTKHIISTQKTREQIEMAKSLGGASCGGLGWLL